MSYRLLFAGSGFERQLAESFEHRLQFERGAAGTQTGGLVALFKLGVGILQERISESGDLFDKFFHLYVFEMVYKMGISKELTTHRASLSSMNQYSER